MIKVFFEDFRHVAHIYDDVDGKIIESISITDEVMSEESIINRYIRNIRNEKIDKLLKKNFI